MQYSVPWQQSGVKLRIRSASSWSSLILTQTLPALTRSFRPQQNNAHSKNSQILHLRRAEDHIN